VLGGPRYDYYTVDAALQPDPLACAVTPSNVVNLRAGAGTYFNIIGNLTPETTATAVGQADDADGYVWWKLDTGAWVREDVVDEVGLCQALPLVG